MPKKGREDNGQFSPGTTGNPNGQPPSRNPIPNTAEAREEVKQFLAESDPSDRERRTRRKVIYEEVYRIAKIRTSPKQQVDAASFLIERADGKPTQPVESKITVTTTADDLEILKRYAGLTSDGDKPTVK